MTPQGQPSLESMLATQSALNQIDLLPQQIQLQQLQQLQLQQQLQQFQSQYTQQPLIDLSQSVDLNTLQSLMSSPLLLLNNQLVPLVQSQSIQNSFASLPIQNQINLNQNNQYIQKNIVSEILRDSEASFNRIPELAVPEVAKFKIFEEKEGSETSTRLSDGFRSEEEKEIEEVRQTPKKRVQRLRTLEVASKSPLVPSPEDSARNGRRMNRWQQSQENKEIDYKAERVRLINETPVDFAAQKIVNLAVGEDKQAVIPALEKRPVRQMRGVWNPCSVDSSALEQFLLEVETIVGLIDQQKCLKLLAEKQGNMEETLILIKSEKKKYINQFGIKPHNKKFFI